MLQLFSKQWSYNNTCRRKCDVKRKYDFEGNDVYAYVCFGNNMGITRDLGDNDALNLIEKSYNFVARNSVSHFTTSMLINLM